MHGKTLLCVDEDEEWRRYLFGRSVFFFNFMIVSAWDTPTKWVFVVFHFMFACYDRFFFNSVYSALPYTKHLPAVIRTIPWMFTRTQVWCYVCCVCARVTALTIHIRARSPFNRRCRMKREHIAQKAIQELKKRNETKWERLCYHLTARPIQTKRRRLLGIEIL